jgi:hypothetical protein
MRRLVAACGFLLGLAAIGYAVMLLLAKPTTITAGEVVVEGTDIGDTAVDTIAAARVVIRNDSNVAIRFVGGPFGCQPGGCLKTIGECPRTIPAHSTAEVILEVSVSAPGSFRLTVPVYLDLAGVGVERTVYLTGTGVPAADNPVTAGQP